MRILIFILSVLLAMPALGQKEELTMLPLNCFRKESPMRCHAPE